MITRGARVRIPAKHPGDLANPLLTVQFGYLRRSDTMAFQLLHQHVMVCTGGDLR